MSRLLLFSSFKGRFIHWTISFMDQLSFPIFLGISRRGTRDAEASNSRLFSTERTIRLLCPRPPSFSWLHFCSLLDILFYWTKPRSLRSCLPGVPTCILSLCRRLHTRGYFPSFLWESIYPIFFNLSPFPFLPPVPSTRNAGPSFLMTCLSSATSFYSASRISNVIIHPSAKLLRES